MKFMISQPMAGKTIEQIRAEREGAVRLLEERGHTVLDSVFAEPAPESIDNVALWYLSQSLEVMAACDGVLFMPGWDAPEARGCRIEYDAAKAYGLVTIAMSYLMGEEE